MKVFLNISSDFDYNHAKRLFKECLRNQMSRNRSIVLLTQQKTFLAECDQILVLKGGKGIYMMNS